MIRNVFLAKAGFFLFKEDCFVGGSLFVVGDAAPSHRLPALKYFKNKIFSLVFSGAENLTWF